MTEPVDTVRVLGGRALPTADADAVRAAAWRTGEAERRLRRAAFGVVQAAHRADRRAWSLPLGATTVPRGRWVALAAEAGAAARRLDATADECALLRDRLLRAAGVYEDGESLAARLVGSVVGPPVAIGLAAAALFPDSPWAPGVIRRVAPWTDETAADLAALIGSPAAVLRGTGGPVTPGARTLSDLLRAVLPETSVTVREVRPTGSGRTWDAATSGTLQAGTVEEALAHIPQLTGLGMVAGDAAAGVPVGTLAVQRVEHDDGRVSWTVVIPGTQELVSTTQPFDGLTDLDLIAHRAADLSAAIEEALGQAGAGPEEPVVLVGHSLGGIVAVQLASSAAFRERHRVGGVVTAGSPTASFAVPAGIPVLHLENDEELVSNLDGLSGVENPRGPDRVTVTRALAASSSALDLAAAGSIPAAHGIRTHLRTLGLAREGGSAPVRDVAGRIEALLGGARTQTRFFTARRVARVPQGVAPSGAEPVSGASSGRRPR